MLPFLNVFMVVLVFSTFIITGMVFGCALCHKLILLVEQRDLTCFLPALMYLVGIAGLFAVGAALVLNWPIPWGFPN